MRNCKDCKWSNEDYVWDEELEDEYQIYTCDKGNDTELDSDCGDFKKYKPKKYIEKDTECDICEYREKCAKYSSGLNCTTSGDEKTHIIYPQDKCIKRAYDCTDFNNSLECRQIDIDQWFKIANTPTNEEIEVLKKAKEMGIEIPENITKYFKEYGIEV